MSDGQKSAAELAWIADPEAVCRIADEDFAAGRFTRLVRCGSCHDFHDGAEPLNGCAAPQLLPDAPRPRGKRHSVKPWREEVAHMIAVAVAEAYATHHALYHEIPAQRPRRWYRRLFG